MKSVDLIAVISAATALNEGSSSDLGNCSAKGIARILDMAVNKVHKDLRKIIRYY